MDVNCRDMLCLAVWLNPLLTFRDGFFAFLQFLDTWYLLKVTGGRQKPRRICATLTPSRRYHKDTRSEESVLNCALGASSHIRSFHIIYPCFRVKDMLNVQVGHPKNIA